MTHFYVNRALGTQLVWRGSARALHQQMSGVDASLGPLDPVRSEMMRLSGCRCCSGPRNDSSVSLMGLVRDSRSCPRYPVFALHAAGQKIEVFYEPSWLLLLACRCMPLHARCLCHGLYWPPCAGRFYSKRTFGFTTDTPSDLDATGLSCSGLRCW